MIKVIFLFVLLLQPGPQVAWISLMQEQLMEIEEEMPGRLGVYVKNLQDGRVLNYNAGNYWYLSSVVKIPLAIAVLQRVEKGEISLEQRLILQPSDFVDGAGDLMRQQPGTTYTVKTLISKMIRNSDSSATDMLFALLGEEELNQQIHQQMVAGGFNRITSLLQVRYEAFGQLHENARQLTNIDFLELRRVPDLHGRLNLLIEKMGVSRSDLKATSIFEAFERYYETGLNSGTLEAMGILLERLYQGQLLNPENTRFLLGEMQNITTGERRIKAGLPQGTPFAQKTGTQIRSACNVGIIIPSSGGPYIIAACVQGNDLVATSEQALRKVGQAISQVMLVEQP